MASKLIDTRGAAAELGVGLRRVQQLVASGRLPAQVMGGTFVIKVVDLKLVRNRPVGRPKKGK